MTSYWYSTHVAEVSPEIKEEPYVDPGSRGTPDKRHLLTGTTQKDLTPDFGTEVKARWSSAWASYRLIFRASSFLS